MLSWRLNSRVRCVPRLALVAIRTPSALELPVGRFLRWYRSSPTLCPLEKKALRMLAAGCEWVSDSVFLERL